MDNVLHIKCKTIKYLEIYGGKSLTLLSEEFLDDTKCTIHKKKN